MREVEIRIKGQLNQFWSEWFGGFKISRTQEGETVLIGHVRDQPELRGIINRLTDLGVDLISVISSFRDEVPADKASEGGSNSKTQNE